MPQKKSGRLTPNMAVELAAVSCHRFAWTAAQTPRGTAQVSAMVIENRTRSALAVIFCKSSGAIGSLNTSEEPQSPVSIPPIQRPYCTRSGSFSPNDSRRPASASGLDCVPMIIIATSPGRILVTAKVIAEIRNRVRSIEKTRLRM